MRISVKISARSSRNEIKILSDGSYKIFLTAAPVDGAANSLLIRLLSDHFKVPKTQIKIVRGLTNKNKIIDINI